MRHEEENHWHPEDRRHPDNRREHQSFQKRENFNDFRSRWGEPDPRFIPGNRDWQEEEAYYREARRRNPEYDWRPFERNRDEHRHHAQEQQQHREPLWRQRDRFFNSSNQHADDRWMNDNDMPHPDHNPHPHHEHRRHNHKGYGRH